MMRLVVLESPYAGEVSENVAYARRCMADCLRRGEAPYASHLLYTQDGILDDDKPDERELGINAGYAWGNKADAAVFYTDRGWSGGMLRALERWLDEGKAIEIRRLEGEPLVFLVNDDESNELALAEVQRLWGAEHGSADYGTLAAFAVLVDRYEAKRYPMDFGEAWRSWRERRGS